MARMSLMPHGTERRKRSGNELLGGSLATEPAGDLVQLAPLVAQIGGQPEHHTDANEADAAQTAADDVRHLLGGQEGVAHPEPTDEQQQPAEGDQDPRGDAVPLIPHEGQEVHTSLTPKIRTRAAPTRPTRAPMTRTR